MPCEQSVRVWIDERGVEGFMKVRCTGTCNANEEPCKPGEYAQGVGSDGKSIIVESCYCNGGKGPEKTECRIIVVKSGDGSRSRKCDGKCDHPDREDCTPVPVGEPIDVPIPVKGKYTGKLGSYRDYKCECKPKG